MNYPSSSADVFRDYMVNREGILEVIDHVLYDTLTYPNDLDDRNTLRFFARPLGAGKSMEDTNMFLCSQLPQPQGFWIAGAGVMVKADPALIPWKMLFSGMGELVVGSKPYFTASPLSTIYTLDGDCKAMLTGIGLISGQSFSFQLKWFSPPKVKKPIRLQARLSGRLYRPVQ